MRGGVLLDPRTGRPSELTLEEELEALSKAPPNVNEWLKKARETKWAGPKWDRQLFRTRISPDNLASLSAVTPSSATETALFAVATYTSIPAFTARAGQHFKLTVPGLITTPSSSGTLVVTPRWGTSSGGVTFGVSATTGTLTASKTNIQFLLECWLSIRSVNNTAATQSTAIASGRLSFDTPIATPTGNVLFGGTQGTVDTTTAQGLWIGLTFSVGSFSVTPLDIIFESLD